MDEKVGRFNESYWYDCARTTEREVSSLQQQKEQLLKELHTLMAERMLSHKIRFMATRNDDGAVAFFTNVQDMHMWCKYCSCTVEEL